MAGLAPPLPMNLKTGALITNGLHISRFRGSKREFPFRRNLPPNRTGPSRASGSPCLSRTHVPRFCSQPLHRPSPGLSVRSRFISARVCQPADPGAWRPPRECFPSRSWPGLRTSARRLAGRCSRIGFTWCWSRCYGRVVHLRQLPTPCCHDAVAFGFQAGERSAWRGLSPRSVYASTGARARTPRPRKSEPIATRGRGVRAPVTRYCGVIHVAKDSGCFRPS
jgi:hypothetical protein